MRRLLLIALISLVAISCTNQDKLSGFKKSNFDTSVRPQDDFFQYVNGTWLKETEIPADKSSYGSFHILYDENQIRLRDIIKESAKSNNEKGSDAQKVGDFYLSYMDSTKIEELGLSPLKNEIDRIDRIDNWDSLAQLFAHYLVIGVETPITFYINQDDKNSVEYIVNLYQTGLGLPDRDYYFAKGGKFDEIRTGYIEYISKIFELIDIENSTEIAETIMQIETDIAENHWTRVENRDDVKTYNKYKKSDIIKLSPNFNWKLFFDSAKLEKADEIIVRQPSYFSALSDILIKYTLDDWKNYSKFRLLNNFAPRLPHTFADANFDFYGKTINGLQVNRPRWKRAVSAINGTLGEVVGKVYVEKYFKPEAKERMLLLVENLKVSMADRIEKLDWMSEETKVQALVKLSKFNAKIGYPDKWKDYSELVVEPDQLIENSIRSSIVEYDREVNKLGKPIDRDEWGMTPQTVNAYYNPTMNEVVFPAAILQPPFFNMEADDAVNYGGIGAVIGHEITHGFDDQGRRYDGDGNMNDWWTKEDNEKFTERAQVVIDQYNQFVPIDSLHINGELTLGENIADIGGLTVSYNAYKISLDGKESETINGFTGEQRVFIGWSQVWRALARDEYLRNQVLTDPHSWAKYRVIGVMNNLPEFYEAFDVKEGDRHYLPEEERVHIW